MSSLVGAPSVLASSHREAPGITLSPKLDATDWYMFRSYEPGRSNYLTMIADYQPFELPVGGPNYYQMDSAGFYDMDIDNVGDGQAHIVFRFRFINTDKGMSVAAGGKTVAVPIINTGQITSADPKSHLNAVEQYTVDMLTMKDGKILSDVKLSTEGGGSLFNKPVDNIGQKSLPSYAAYANDFIYVVKIPGCADGKVFVGQRKDPFYINVGETFDLVSYKHPIGEQFANSAHDDLEKLDVTSLALEVPTNCITKAEPVIGGWTSAYKNVTATDSEQKSRLGNPLVNELVIGLPDKDAFNASQPSGDAQFAKYVTNPSLPVLLHTLFPSLTAPTQYPRQDLEAVFLTGIASLNKPAKVTPAEEMRLNTKSAIVPAAQQNPLGVIGGDKSGYPNGRRLGDDVVDISLRVVIGKLYTLGLFGGASNAPSGSAELTDGVRRNASFYATAFPYVQAPLPGSPQSVLNK
jgi:hypothetical protein